MKSGKSQCAFAHGVVKFRAGVVNVVPIRNTFTFLTWESDYQPQALNSGSFGAFYTRCINAGDFDCQNQKFVNLSLAGQG